MLKESKEMKDADETIIKKVEARNELENVILSSSSPLANEGNIRKLSNEDKEVVSAAVQEAEGFLENDAE